MPFAPPLQTEVSKYIKEKKNWPDSFIQYYTDRFWSFYQSNGWKVSGKAPMKDWKAAFCSQWQTLKFKEDIDFYNKCMNEKKPVSQDKNIQYLNDVLLDYKVNYDKFPLERYEAIYDYLKEKRAIKLTKQEITDILEIAHGDVKKGKMFCIRTFFDKMINQNLNFSNIMK